MEYWDTYDDQRRLIPGVKLIRGEPVPKGMNSLVAHVWFINAARQLLIQRRAFDRPLGAGLWFCTGGAALAGEDTLAACVRETREEMGFTPDMAKALIPISMKGPDYFVDVFMIPAEVKLEDLRLQAAEVIGAKWVTLDELDRMVASGEFWRVRYYDMLKQFIREQYG